MTNQKKSSTSDGFHSDKSGETDDGLRKKDFGNSGLHEKKKKDKK